MSQKVKYEEKNEEYDKKQNGLQILFGENYQQWVWKKSQLSYTTPIYISNVIADLINRIYIKPITNKQHILNKTIIWDMFTGLGVDLIAIANIDQDIKVYGTELSPIIFNLLEKNVQIYNLNNKIELFNKDCVKCLDSPNFRNIDIIYFDPPWGKSFNNKKIFDFSYVTLENGTNVISLLKRIYKSTKNIIIKSPLRCNTFESLDFLKIHRIIIFRKHHLKFIFCK